MMTITMTFASNEQALEMEQFAREAFRVEGIDAEAEASGVTVAFELPARNGERLLDHIESEFYRVTKFR